MRIEPALILPLSDPAAELSRVGRKGASLARLTAAGLPGLDGFYITTAGIYSLDGAPLSPVQAHAPLPLPAWRCNPVKGD